MNWSVSSSSFLMVKEIAVELKVDQKMVSYSVKDLFGL